MSATITNNINIAEQHDREVASGERFEFGKNWSAFLAVLDDERIAKAEESLREMLEVESLEGKTFLDIGSGSGLFSLAARRLGATVHSFDFDSNSFACTQELRKRYFPNDANWRVEQGSALDADYVASLGKFDIVYSWGCFTTLARCGVLSKTRSSRRPSAASFSSRSTTTLEARHGVGTG